MLTPPRINNHMTTTRDGEEKIKKYVTMTGF